MGSCCSFTTSPNANQPPPTAKVVTPSGALWEFSSPIKSSLLVDASSPFFVCNSDYLLYDERVPALRPGDPLLPGHLYFILPVEKLELSLTGEEMVELAVRASAALMATNKKAAGRKKNDKSKMTLMSRMMPGGGAAHDDVRVDDYVGVPLRPSVQRSRTPRARVAPASTGGSSLDTIEEEAEAEP